MTPVTKEVGKVLLSHARYHFFELCFDKIFAKSFCRESEAKRQEPYIRAIIIIYPKGKSLCKTLCKTSLN